MDTERRMPLKSGTRALLGVGMWLIIYLLGVYLIPKVGPIARLVERTGWLSNGEISQVSFLILSLMLIFRLPGGDRKTYGFQTARIGQLIAPVAYGVLVSVGFFVLNIVAFLFAGPPGSPGGGSVADKSLLNFIITVVILASVCEEIFNRGLVQGFLTPMRERSFRLFGLFSLPVTIVGFLFGLGHLCLLRAMGPRMVILIVVSASALGLIAGYYREKTGSLLPAIAVHMTFNVVSGVIPKLLMVIAGGMPAG
jgi:membrane protease YdiL (CAAX protease family)